MTTNIYPPTHTDWVRCDDDNQPENTDNVLVAFLMEDSMEWVFVTYRYCTFGWKVLSRMVAYFMELMPPVLEVTEKSE